MSDFLETLPPTTGSVGRTPGPDPLTLTGNYPAIGFNSYWDGSVNRYVSDGFAAQIYRDATGNLIFQTSPSGLAGEIITYTTRFTIPNHE